MVKKSELTLLLEDLDKTFKTWERIGAPIINYQDRRLRQEGLQLLMNIEKEVSLEIRDVKEEKILLKEIMEHLFFVRAGEVEQKKVALEKLGEMNEIEKRIEAIKRDSLIKINKLLKDTLKGFKESISKEKNRVEKTMFRRWSLEEEQEMMRKAGIVGKSLKKFKRAIKKARQNIVKDKVNDALEFLKQAKWALGEIA